MRSPRVFCLLVFSLLPVPQSMAEEFNPLAMHEGNIEDNPFSTTIHQGVERVIKETELCCKEIIVDTNQKQYASNVEAVANQGYSPLVLLHGSHIPEQEKRIQ